MPHLFGRQLLAVATFAAVIATLAGCDESNPPAPLPITASPGTVVTLQPSLFVLKPSQMTAYQRTASIGLTPGQVAEGLGDPSLKTLLEAEGFVDGAQSTFQPPTPTSPTPFAQVIDSATIFRDVAGAAKYFSEQAARRHQQPSSGGTLSDVTGLPTSGVDQVVGYVTSDTSVPDSPQAFVVLVRRGRVVAELFAGGNPATATQPQLTLLLNTQEQLLQQSPEVRTG